MIRETIDIYLSRVDKKKVGLLLELWFITFLTAAAGHAVATSGDGQWDLLTYVVAWLGFLVAMEGLIPLLATFFARWILGQIPYHLAEKEREPAKRMHLPPMIYMAPPIFHFYWRTRADEEAPSAEQWSPNLFSPSLDAPATLWDVSEDAEGVRPGEQWSPCLSEPSCDDPEGFWDDLGDDDEGAPPAERFPPNLFDSCLDDPPAFWDDRADDEEVPYE